MGVIFDIIGSLIVRGMIVLALVSLNITLSNALYDRSQRAAAGQNLASLVQVVQYEFNAVGYNAAVTPFVAIDSNSVTFFADIDNDGTADNVKYYLGSGSGSDPPTHQVLYRRINGGAPMQVARDVVGFNLKYYDSTGAETSTLANIKSLYVTITLESHDAINGKYQRVSWESQLFPQDL